MYEGRNGASRLAYSLHCIKNDKGRVQALAKLLNYNTEQLEQDIQALFALTGDSITTTAAKGYAYAACVGTGINQPNSLVFLDCMDEAMANMEESEAEDLYGSGAI